MKNDFDFIKDKVENSSVKAPDDMGASFALDTISDVSPKPVALNKPKHHWKKTAAIAATIVLAAAVGVTLGVRFFSEHIHVTPVGVVNLSGEDIALPGGLKLVRFNDRKDVESAVRSIRANHQADSGTGLLDSLLYGAKNEISMDYAESADNLSASNSVAAASTATGGSSNASSSHSETYKQVDGVDEADIIKTDGRYIYCVNSYGSATVRIFAADSDDPRCVATINVADSSTATGDEVQRDDFDYEYYYLKAYSVEEMYVNDDRLIVMVDRYDDDSMTTAQVYDISDINNITLLHAFTQSGCYTSSRMIGDTLYTVSSYYPYGEKLIPYCGNVENPGEIAADCIYSYEEPERESFLVVSAYNTVDYTAQTESKAILGAAEDIYCSLNNLYIYSTEYDYPDYDVDGYYYGYSYSSTSRILKVDLTDGLRFTAYTEIDGYIDDQYALDESNGYLRVATTSTENGHDVNNLFVLDESLGVVGSVNGFARGESIKAVRYVGDTAYVITYEQTDPLFVIDLSEPTAPEILGEVKISGFSTMLVPVDENTVLGLGYYTAEEDYTDLEVQEGFKLALFDVSDKAHPQVLDSISYPHHYSPVQYDPKALVYNPERGDFIVPLNYHYYGSLYDAENGYFSYGSENYGGMLNFKVEDGSFVETTRYRADFEVDVERCVYVGDTIYMTHSDYGDIELTAMKYE